MPTWTTNNLACIDLWSTTFIMKQHKKTFKKAEFLKMKELLFYNPLLTKEELEFEAMGIAAFLDKVFKTTYEAKYEENVDKAKAIKDMVAILVDGGKTMPDLAKAIDDDYIF
jgi:hypothetical protein